MKKLLIITNITSFVLCVFFAIYANIQTGYAKENLIKAEAQEKLANEIRLEAEKMAELAQTEAANARRAENQANIARDDAVDQEKIAEDQKKLLEACKKGK